jgi:hypothetical protein
MSLRRLLRGAAASLLLLLVAAPPPIEHSIPTVGRSANIVIILMENHSYSQIIGSASAPYINSMARQGVLLTRSYGVAHPSLPNYLALIGGSTFGIRTNCTNCSVNKTNLVDQLQSHGVSWKAYMESMPYACYKGAQRGLYVKRHNPFMYFRNIRESPKRCRKVVFLAQLKTDLSAGKLPQFAWITPNLCNDMHDCSIAAGDRWLKNWVPQIIPKLGTNGVVILTFDEGIDGRRGGGHIATIIFGPGAKIGAKIGTVVNHYSVLRLIESNWRLGHLRKANTATTISGWRR